MRTAARPSKPRQGLDFGGRLACALGSLLFSLPICGLLWLAFNVWMAGNSFLLSPRLLAWVIGAMSLLAFVAPKTFAKVMGWLAEGLFALGK
jgi:hypothetical protein